MRLITRSYAGVPLAVLALSLTLCAFAAAQDDEVQAAVDNLTRSVNASVARQVEQANKMAEAARQNAGVTAHDNITIVTCTNADGHRQTVKVGGLTKNTVVVNCRTDDDGQPHIIVKGDGATREIGVVKVEGATENTVIANDRHIGRGTNISAQGKNAKASVGVVEVRGGQVKNSAIINNAVVNGGTVKATGEGATATAGSIIVQ